MLSRQSRQVRLVVDPGHVALFVRQHVLAEVGEQTGQPLVDLATALPCRSAQLRTLANKCLVAIFDQSLLGDVELRIALRRPPRCGRTVSRSARRCPRIRPAWAPRPVRCRESGPRSDWTRRRRTSTVSRFNVRPAVSKRDDRVLKRGRFGIVGDRIDLGSRHLRSQRQRPARTRRDAPGSRAARHRTDRTTAVELLNLNSL